MATSVLKQPESAVLARKIALNTVVQMLGRAVSLVLNVVAVIALVRYLGVEKYGSYVFITSFVSIFGFVADFGISRIAIRDMSRERSAIGRLLGTSIALRVLLSIGAIVLSTGVSLLFGQPLEVQLGVAIASTVLLVEALKSLNSLFQAELAMQYDAAVQVIMRAVDTGLVLGLIFAGGPLLTFLAVPIASGLVSALISLAIVRKRFHIRFEVDTSAFRSMLVESLPVAATMFISLLYLRADALLLGGLVGEHAVGVYGAAYRPVDYLLLVVATLFVNAIYPVLTRLHGADPTRFKQVFQRGFEVLMAAIVPVAVVATVFADQLVNLVYSSQYAASAAPLRVLMWVTVGMFVTHYLGTVLLAVNQQRSLVVPFAIGALVNLSANLALIPMWSYMGAAVAILATVAVLGVLLYGALRREAGIRIGVMPLARLLVANALAGDVMFFLGQTNWLFGLAVGCLAYPALVLVCRVFVISDIRQLIGSGQDREPPSQTYVPIYTQTSVGELEPTPASGGSRS